MGSKRWIFSCGSYEKLVQIFCLFINDIGLGQLKSLIKYACSETRSADLAQPHYGLVQNIVFGSIDPVVCKAGGIRLAGPAMIIPEFIYLLSKIYDLLFRTE